MFIKYLFFSGSSKLIIESSSDSEPDDSALKDLFDNSINCTPTTSSDTPSSSGYGSSAASSCSVPMEIEENENLWDIALEICREDGEPQCAEHDAGDQLNNEWDSFADMDVDINEVEASDLGLNTDHMADLRE